MTFSSHCEENGLFFRLCGLLWHFAVVELFILGCNFIDGRGATGDWGGGMKADGYEPAALTAINVMNSEVYHVL